VNFQLIAGNLALDFVNTVGNRLGDAEDYLVRAADVTRWARLAGLGPVTVTPRQLHVVRATREEMYHLFRGGSLAPLNARLPTRRLERRGGVVRWRWDDPDRLLGPILLSAAELLVSGAQTKIRQCDDETCGWLFLDRSRAGRRRWCSMADCGNRAKVRRYYRRWGEVLPM
jgi:predicted RNA-binding Zn ribbon-like protein